MYQDWNKGVEEFVEAIVRHLCFWHTGCFLWWLGGFFSLAWMRLILIDALDIMPDSLVLTEGMANVYFMSLAFCFAYKKAEKNSNGDDDKKIDRYKGEVWVIAWLLFYTAIQYDLSSPVGSFKILWYFGGVKKMPALVNYTMYGVLAALGVTRLGKVGEMLKSVFPNISKKLFGG